MRNNLKMGVVGLPNVGKSSLFNLLCEQSCAAVRGNTVCASRVRKTHSSAALQENCASRRTPSRRVPLKRVFPCRTVTLTVICRPVLYH